MWHSMRLWRDWVMNELSPAARRRPSGQAVHVRYEQAGLLLAGPVPWNATAVLVEVLLRLPPAGRQKADFILRFPGQPPILPDHFRADDSDPKRFRLSYRLSVPPATVAGELLWRQHFLAAVEIPILRPADFLAGLALANATLAVRIGDQTVAATGFIPGQCRGLTAAAVLKSNTPLAPLAELGLCVRFRGDRGLFEQTVPLPLTGTQLGQREALLTAVLPKPPRSAGGFSAEWRAGETVLYTRQATAVAKARFVASLRVADARFAVQDKLGTIRLFRHAAPPGADAVRIGPCFVLHAREPGLAGTVTLAAVALRSGGAAGPSFEKQVLITDGPTVFAPGLLDPADLAGVTAFEVRHKDTVIGSLSLNPVPTATYDAEGAYRPPPEFAWTPTAEDELTERLKKLG
jgi:hypothetical protein